MARSILIITPFYYEPPRHKTCVMELATGLSRHAKVTVISSLIEGARAFERHGNLTIYRFRPWLYMRSIPYLIDPLLWCKIIQVVREENSDIILAVTIQFLSSFMAALVKGTLGVPLTVWTQADRATFGNPILDLIPQLYDLTLGRYLMHRADKVFVQTDILRDRVRRLGVADQDISLLANGIDTERFRPGLDASRVRQELGIPEGRPVILFVGNLFPRKGVRYLLEASKAIIQQHPDALFVITGVGPLEEELKAQARQINPARFLFIGFRRDIPLLLNLATLLVLPSLTEGLPQTILEAYACGVPVVATDVGGVKDILQDGEHGFILPPGDPTAIAEAVNTLLGDGALRNHISAHNRETALGQYDLAAIAKRTWEEMQDLHSAIAPRRRAA